MPKSSRKSVNSARASPISRPPNDVVSKTSRAPDDQETTLPNILERYPYSPVDKTAGEIRLIKLIPGTFSDEIRVELSTVSLTRETKSSFEFEALSYVWGSPQNPIKITVVDGKQDYFLEVTQNLACVLPYLRSNKPRILWIDAICINQQDLAERSQQVLRMRDIYEWAKRVVVWLGPPDQAKGLAIAAMYDLGRRSTVDWHSSNITWHDNILKRSSPFMDTMDSSEDSLNLARQIPYNEATLEALSTLLSSEWFERLWVWQEIHLANPQATLFCGHDHILWSQFRNAVFSIYTVRRRRNDLGSVLQQIFDFCDFAENTSINSILRATRKLKCMDPRDRIYAVQGILPKIDDDYRMLEPDYGHDSEMEVYKDFVFRCINGSHGLQILQLCSLGGHPFTEENDIPSWIPNFFVREGSFHERQLLYASAMSMCPRAIVEHDNLRSFLIVKGFSCKKNITAIQKNITGERLEFWKTALMIRKFWNLLIRNEGPDDTEARIRPLARSLIAGHYAESTEPPDSALLSLSQYEKALREVIDGASYIFTDETSEFLSFVWDYIQGRVLFITSDGEFGLAPEESKLGDSIYLLMGSDLPFILRSHATVEKHGYQVVGPCYCSGIMDGEALLGPLPTQYRIVDVYNDRVKTYVTSFLDTGTGETQLEDPRLGDLPKGWKRQTVDEDISLQYVNEMGEECFGDPRLMPVALREMGIELKDVVLV